MLDSGTLLTALFWMVLLFVAQTYLLYPLELYLVTLLAGRQTVHIPDEYPSVTLVIASYNEESVIGEKIQNCLSLTYPSDKLDIVVFSDASTDATDNIVRSYDGVDLRRIEGRVGKTSCQNRVVAELDSEVVVFSDANSMYDQEAIQRLIGQFDEGVDCVVGELRYTHGGVTGESVYWRYEQLIKRLESTFHSLVAGNGAIYAVRREAYIPLPAEAISDFAEPLAIIRGGQMVRYAPNAIAWERTGDTVESELTRRVRIIRRSWATVVANRDLLNPLRHPRVAFQIFSHKVLRWSTPLFLPVLLALNTVFVVQIGSVLYWVLLVGQLLGYSFAGVGFLYERGGRSPPTLFHTPYYFLLSNYGMLRGLVEYLYEGTVVAWDTADRSTSE